MWLTVKALENDKVVTEKLKGALSDSAVKYIEQHTNGTDGAIAVGECKFRWIDGILDGAVSETKTKAALGRLDRIYTHKIFGKPAVVLTVLLELLKDGRSRTVEMLAEELDTTADDIRRQLEYLERIGAVRKVAFPSGKSCGSCSGCDGGGGCKGCMPDNAEANMDDIWEVCR